MQDARTTDALIRELRDAADEGLSVLASSPFRLRHRGPVRAMVDLVEPMDFALRNTRVLVRRVAVACYRREPMPTVLRGARAATWRHVPTRWPASSRPGGWPRRRATT